MKLTYKDIISKHKNIPAVVALHGPSLNNDKDRIQQLQKESKILRFSVNEWYDFFSERPDYWVVSNGEFTIKSSINNDALWRSRDYPEDVFNKYNIPLLYNRTADHTSDEFIEKHLHCDYLQYDGKHFKNRDCKEILLSFKKHYEKNKNLEFYEYGNNCHMWKKPDVSRFPGWMKKIHGRIGNGWDIKGNCCGYKLDITIQEKLQEISKHSQHACPGQTVGLHAVMFAIIMGCNPIYITGLDLDYSAGYANTAKDHNQFIHPGNVGHWKYAYKDFLLDDMRIIRESAELLGIKIVNLNKNSWYNTFTKGDLVL
mgnify:FL=1|tara:strand:+ start:43 stop:981 length:939 start_codon:yes stop_codon:yes gene_type:complete